MNPTLHTILGTSLLILAVLEVDVDRLEVRDQPGGDGHAPVGVLDPGSAQTVERAV